MGLPAEDLLKYFKRSSKSKGGRGNRSLRFMARKCPRRSRSRSSEQMESNSVLWSRTGEIDLWLRKCKVSDEAIETIKVLLTYDAEQRPTATEVILLLTFIL